MKNLHMKSLATAVLIGGSLLASTGAMASIGSDTDGLGTPLAAAAAGAGVINAPGSSCEAYNAGQEELLVTNWSSMGATGQVWVHCPINAPVLNATLNSAGSLTLNVQMPISTTSTVYNCYVAQQTLNSSATTNRTVVWGRNSGVGNVSVGFGAVGTTNGHLAPTTFSLASMAAGAVAGSFTLTSGCLLNTGDQLHSTQFNAL